MLNFLIKNPSISHGLSAFYKTALLTVLYVGLHYMKWDRPEVLAFISISILYYGRESGQREHDLKNMGVGSVLAAFGADYMFKWSGSNLVQWLGAVIGAALMAIILILISVYLIAS